MSEQFKVKLAVCVLLEKDGKVLLHRRYNTGFADGLYDMPSGHVDEGELPSIAAARELKEETGVDVDISDLIFVTTLYKNSHNPYVYFVFVARKWHGEPQIMEPHACDDMQWFDKNELPENTLFFMKDAIMNYFSDAPKELIEYSQRDV